MFRIVLLVVILCYSCVNAWQSSSISGKRYSSLSMLANGRKPLMGGNWKLNPKSVQESINLATEVAKLTKGVSDVDVVLFPPHPFLVPVFTKIEASNVKLGAQDCFFESEGAYTGAVSTCMLKDIGTTYVLCGHSERRTLFGDDDFAINRKVKKILKEGLLPVLCCGETQEEYEAGLNHEVCACQLLKDLSDISAEDMSKIVIAYEPVWAIGTGLVCPADVAQEVHAFIRSVIAKKYGSAIADKVIIQYGGSVKPDNVKEIMSKPDIDGCLVGGASLSSSSFAKIVNFKE